MAKKDYYEILGVDKNVTDDELKKVWKKLAVKYHPDKYADKSEEERKEAEEKFKEIAEAYDVLSDKEKRRKYDMGDMNMEFGGFGDMAYDDIIRNFMRMNDFDPFLNTRFGGRNYQKVKKGSDINLKMTITLDDIYNQREKEIKCTGCQVCSHCNGTGFGENGRIDVCPRCNGTGSITNVKRNGYTVFQQITQCPDCNGTGIKVVNPCSHCHGTGLEKTKLTKKIKIPAGCFDFATYQLPNQGNPSERKDGINGDLNIVFVIDKNSPYLLDPNNVYNIITELEVPVLDCIVGEKESIKCIDGKTRVFSIEKGTTNGKTYRLKGCGMPDGNGGYGDMIVYIKQKMPTKISNDELKKINELRESKNFK